MMHKSRKLDAEVDILERKVAQKILEIEVAETHYKDSELNKLKEELSELVSRLDGVVATIDATMSGFQEWCSYEEKALLSGLGQEKQVFVRGVSPHSRRSPSGEAVPAQTQATTKANMYSQIAWTGKNN